MSRQPLRAVAALRGLETDRVPVAPLLGAVSARLAGIDVCDAYRDVALQTRAQAAAVDAFEPDLIFPFMDLTAEPEALGARVSWRPGSGPEVCGMLQPEQLLMALERCEVHGARLPVYSQVVGALSQSVGHTCAVGAYVSGPWTLVSSALGLAGAARLMRRDPDMAGRLAQLAAGFARELAREAVDAGAVVIMILEPCVAGGILSPADFGTVVRPGILQLAQSIRRYGAEPVLHVCGDTGPVLSGLADLGGLALSVDHPTPLGRVLEAAGPDTPIMGNLDPVNTLMRGTPEQVTAACRGCLPAAAGSKRFILATGCEVPLLSPPETLRAMCRSVVESPSL